MPTKPRQVRLPLLDKLLFWLFGFDMQTADCMQNLYWHHNNEDFWYSVNQFSVNSKEMVTFKKPAIEFNRLSELKNVKTSFSPLVLRFTNY